MFKRIALFSYLAAFFTVLCGGYAGASDNLLRLPSIARYSPDRLDKAVRETNAVPMNPFLIFEGDRGDVTIDERTIVIGTGGGDCAGLNAFIRRVVLKVAELNANLKPGEKKWRVVGVGNNYDGMTADNWQAKPAEPGKLVELTLENTKLMPELPSTVLGSCRRKLSGEDLAKIAKRFGNAAGMIISGGNDHLKGVEQIADFIRDPEAVKRNEAGKIVKFIREKITNPKREQLLGDLDEISMAAGKVGDENIARLKKDFQRLHDDMGSPEDLTKLVVQFIKFAKAFNEYLEYVEVELSGKKPNLRTVGAPKSIDNDFGDDDKMAMLGFKSAYRFGRQIASRASLDPENTENKNKVAVFEVMGRGWHSLTENCARGCPYPYATIIPGKKVSIDDIIDAANKGIKNFFVSEGFSLSEKDEKLGELLEVFPMLRAMWDKAIDPEKRAQDAHGNPKLTGASLYVVGILKHFCGLEIEPTDLTYELRGAFPQAGASDSVAFDIALAELFGDAAVSIVLDKTKESGLALTYPGYEDANKQVTPKPAKDVYKSRKLKGATKGRDEFVKEENELAKFGVLGLEKGFNVTAQIRNAEVPKIDGSIESAARKFFYGINISTRTHKYASVVEFRIPDEAMISACGREQDLESMADGGGLRTVVEATKDSALLLISQERVSFSEIADEFSNIYNKFGYVNIAISNNFPLNKDDKFLQKILAKDPVLKARFESEARDLGDGWVKFDSGVSHFIVGLFKECEVKKGTRGTNSGYAFRGLAATSSPDILKNRDLLASQGVMMAKPAAGRLADGKDDERIYTTALTPGEHSGRPRGLINRIFNGDLYPLEEREIALAEKAINRLLRRLPHDLKQLECTEERKQEVLDAACYMKLMLPEGNTLSIAEIIDRIVPKYTNWLHAYRVKHGELRKREELLPPIFTFSSVVYPEYPGEKPRYISLYYRPQFLTIETIHSKASNDEDISAKGGYRVYYVNTESLIQHLRGEEEKRIKPALPEGVDLSLAMKPKNFWWGTGLDGKKTLTLVNLDAKEKEKEDYVFLEEELRLCAASFISAGIACKIARFGPDMNTGGVQDIIIEEGYRVQQELGVERAVLASTSGSPKRGSFSHSDLMVTSISAIETMLTDLEDIELMKRYGIDPKNFSVSMQGFGETITGSLSYISETYPELFGYMRLCGLSNVPKDNSAGGIYNENGLDVKYTLELVRKRNRLLQQNKGMDSFSLIAEYKGDCEKLEGKKGTGDVLFKGADIIIPGAVPDMFKSVADIKRLKEAGTKAMYEIANTSIRPNVKVIREEIMANLPNNLRREELEKNLARYKKEILYLEDVFDIFGIYLKFGPITNGGGIRASREQIEHWEREGKETLIRKMEERGVHVQDDIADLSILHTLWLNKIHLDTGVSPYRLFLGAIPEIEESFYDFINNPDEAMNALTGQYYRQHARLTDAKHFAAADLSHDIFFLKGADPSVLIKELDSKELTIYGRDIKTRMAIFALGRIELKPDMREAVVDKLIKILLDKTRQPQVRKSAAECLGFFLSKRAMDTLKKAVEDEDIHVRVWAKWALERIGSIANTNGLGTVIERSRVAAVGL